MDQPWVLGKRPRGNAQKDAVLALGPWEVLIGLGSWDTHTRQPAHGLSTQGTACPHTRVPEQPPPPNQPRLQSLLQALGGFSRLRLRERGFPRTIKIDLQYCLRRRTPSFTYSVSLY